MHAEEVIDIYKELNEGNVQVWIDGGWAVDALLEKVTRPHQDLDLAVQHKDLEMLVTLLGMRGFNSITRDKKLMWDVVLADKDGKEIEIHAFSFDNNGDVIEENDWNGYSADSLTGEGKILDTQVKCVNLKQLVKTHDKNNRTLKPTDVQDMELLEKKFGVSFP